MYNYKVKEVTRVIDGDTVDCIVDLGFNISIKGRFRLSGYDAPETWRPKTDKERIAGEKVTQFLTTLLETHKDNIIINSTKMGIYGRYDGVLFYKNEAEELINVNEKVECFIIENFLTKEEVRN